MKKHVVQQPKNQKNEDLKMQKINLNVNDDKFEVLEDAVAPSLGINCKHGILGVWCN